MSKLRKRLSKWFLDTAKKLDSDTVYDNCTIPIPSRDVPIIMYDQYHVDKIHVQHQIANVTLDAYNKVIDTDEMIKRRLTEAISDLIYKNYEDDIKKVQMADSPWNESTLYYLDLYVCKPQRKKEGDI